MSHPSRPDAAVSARLLDVMIRAGLIGVLAALCYIVFAPFPTLMVWALVISVVLHPLQQWTARRMGGKQGLASILLVIVGVLFLVVPSAVLTDSFGSSIHDEGKRLRHAGSLRPPGRHAVLPDPLAVPALDTRLTWPGSASAS